LGGSPKFTGGRIGSGWRIGHGGTNFYAWSNDRTSGNADIAHGNAASGHDAGNNDSTKHNSLNAGNYANYSGHHDAEHHDTQYGQPKHNDSEHHYPEHHYPELDNAKHSYTRSAGQLQSRRNVFHKPE
jgi:hypothetical protein